MKERQPVLRLSYIRKRRIERNLTQTQMASRLGFKNASTYMKYEKGEYAFKADHLPVIAALLDCSIDQLYSPGIYGEEAEADER